jgi:hypothetical protein
LVAHYVRDVGVGRSSRLFSTKESDDFSPDSFLCPFIPDSCVAADSRWLSLSNPPDHATFAVWDDKFRGRNPFPRPASPSNTPSKPVAPDGQP